MALGLCVLAVASTAVRLHAQTGELTADELAAIERGELVAREWRQTRPPHVWVGGASYLRIPRSRAEVWRALHDLPRWRDMLPAATETRRVDALAGDPLVEIHHAYGPIRAQYTVRAHFDETARRCTLDLDSTRAHDIDGGRAIIEVHRWHHARDASLVVWAVLADPGDGLLMPLVLDAIQHWAVRVPVTLAAFLEGPGAELYR